MYKHVLLFCGFIKWNPVVRVRDHHTEYFMAVLLCAPNTWAKSNLKSLKWIQIFVGSLTKLLQHHEMRIKHCLCSNTLFNGKVKIHLFNLI